METGLRRGLGRSDPSVLPWFCLWHRQGGLAGGWRGCNTLAQPIQATWARRRSASVIKSYNWFGLEGIFVWSHSMPLPRAGTRSTGPSCLEHFQGPIISLENLFHHFVMPGAVSLSAVPVPSSPLLHDAALLPAITQSPNKLLFWTFETHTNRVHRWTCKKFGVQLSLHLLSCSAGKWQTSKVAHECQTLRG